MSVWSHLELKDYQKWRNINRDCFSVFDYLRGSLISGESSPDVIMSFARLVYPQFVEKDGMVFIEDIFSQQKLSQFRLQGLRVTEIEYWMNLLGISDILISFPDSFVLELIVKIKRTWEDQLTVLYPGRTFEVIEVDDDGYTFLTVTTKGG